MRVTKRRVRQMAKIKQKKCRVCRCPFTPDRPMQIVCTIECAKEKARSDRVRKAKAAATAKRKETALRKESIKTKPVLTREAQAEFNKYIRARDEGKPCISCGKPDAGVANQRDAGHYRSVGSCPELRFDEDNVMAQCISCNRYLSGNAVYYRLGLIDRIGLERVERVEGKHPPKNYTHDQLRAIKATYRAKIKEIERGN